MVFLWQVWSNLTENKYTSYLDIIECLHRTEKSLLLTTTSIIIIKKWLHFRLQLANNNHSYYKFIQREGILLKCSFFLVIAADRPKHVFVHSHTHTHTGKILQEPIYDSSTWQNILYTVNKAIPNNNNKRQLQFKLHISSTFSQTNIVSICYCCYRTSKTTLMMNAHTHKQARIVDQLKH